MLPSPVMTYDVQNAEAPPVLPGEPQTEAWSAFVAEAEHPDLPGLTHMTTSDDDDDEREHDGDNDGVPSEAEAWGSFADNAAHPAAPALTEADHLHQPSRVLSIVHSTSADELASWGAFKHVERRHELVSPQHARAGAAWAPSSAETQAHAAIIINPKLDGGVDVGASRSRSPTPPAPAARWRWHAAAHHLMGTMPAGRKWMSRRPRPLQFVDAVLRGFGQVVFMNNPVTGVFILAAITLASRYNAVMMVLGAAASTAVAPALGLDKGSFANGIYGYNGALCGLGVAAFHFGGDGRWDAMPQIAVPVVLVSCLSTIVTAGVGGLLVGKFDLSPFTLPFNLSLWIWLLGTASFTYFPVNGNLLQPGLNTNPDVLPDVEPVDYASGDVVKAVFRGVAQVFLQDSTACGVIIVVGMAVCSPVSAFFAVFGSAAGTLTALGMGVDATSVYHGLWGYNSCLSAVAIGGLFFVLRGGMVWVYVVMVAVFSAMLTGAVAAFMAPLGLPAGTFPFVLACWVFCLSGKAMKALHSVELATVTTPEDIRRRYCIATTHV